MMRGSELLKTRVSELEEFVLAETEGFAYIPQAAVWLASQTLRSSQFSNLARDPYPQLYPQKKRLSASVSPPAQTKARH